MTTTPDIFISYDSRDKDYVKQIASIMQSVGLKARTDFDLPFGANFYRYMEAALRECFAALLIISKIYVENDSWARIELMDLISRHVKGQSFVIPLIIDDIPSDLLPFGLQTVHYIKDTERNPQKLRIQFKVLRDQLVSKGIGSLGTTIIAPTEYDEKSERRIRVQMIDVCNFKVSNNPCPWCHWDEFDEKNITRQPERVLSVLRDLKEVANSGDIFPRPRMDFTLTGGEPLYDHSYLPRFLKLCSENSFVITNGYYLEKEIETLRESKVRNIRISLQPGIRDENTEQKIMTGIQLLLEQTMMNVRFNNVLPLISGDIRKTVREIDAFINNISNKFHSYLGDRIKGFAFIEQFTWDSNSKTDIFRIADTWEKRHHLQHEELPPLLSRKRKYKYGNLEIEFVKVNCDYIDDYVWRCLSCAIEKDICLAADARIRICSGWDINSLKPKYIYAHYSESSPLKSISGAIKREYGTVAFYTHLTLWTRIIQKESLSEVTEAFVKQCQLNRAELKTLIREVDPKLLINDKQDFDNWGILRKIADLVLRENGPFVRIYHEGASSHDKHTNSIKLCAHLIKSAYQLSRVLADTPHHGVHRPAFLTTLLLLEYLSVDESLFSTGRTVLAQGISTELLREIVRGSHLSTIWMSDAIYCLGAIAMENTETSSVEHFVKFLTDSEQRESAAQIQYLLGCIFRQQEGETFNQQEEENSRAAKTFETCASLAKSGIHDPRKRMSLFKWLYLELEAEANRSLGSALKTSPARRLESQKAFEIADLLSIIYDTKLRYTALFSDAYAAMCRYFLEGHKEGDKREALRNFSDSLSLNPNFYACLIRMAILELALGYFENSPILIEKATKHLYRARDIFSDRGLLTDQEYLNSLLCEYSLAISDERIIVNSLPDPMLAGIALCKRIGKKDVECVRNDAQFLLQIHPRRTDARSKKIDGVLKDFIEQCNQLIDDL